MIDDTVATICLYALVSVSESVSVKFSVVYLVSKVSEKVVSVHLFLLVTKHAARYCTISSFWMSDW